jgi:DNA modification methylase
LEIAARPLHPVQFRSLRAKEGMPLVSSGFSPLPSRLFYAMTAARKGADVMVLRGMRTSKANGQQVRRVGASQLLAPLSEQERAILDKVSACSVVRAAVDRLRPAAGHARVHSDAKITALAAAMRRFGFIEPIIVDAEFNIIAGLARWLAAQKMGLVEVPVIVLPHLSAVEIRALRIAMGRFPEWAAWDLDQLRVELPAIVAQLPDLAVEELGFSVPEVDRLTAPSAGQSPDPADDIPEINDVVPPVSRTGDLWRLGQHFALCDDALKPQSYDRLLSRSAVRLTVSDPPYNVPINGHVTKRIGKFAEFAMASGELTDDQFREFLRKAFAQIARVSVAGAIGFFFIDWRHARVMQEAADGVFCELKNFIVWAKDSPALGTFYRSQHEFVLAFKIADGKHINNFELGQHGRTRSNVWSYAGMSSFSARRDEALALHATPKPVAMLVDAILDCSNPGDLVLDPFGGSGSTLIAAERAHRRARLIEISPTYVDTTVRRWERFTGESAVLVETNEAFSEVARRRGESANTSAEGSVASHKVEEDNGKDGGSDGGTR